MLYYRLEDDYPSEWGMTLHDIRSQNPRVGIPEAADVSHLGWFSYHETEPPMASWDETVVEVAPVEGEQRWRLVKVDTATKAARLEAMKIEKLTAIDSERTKRQQLDFPYDFGTTLGMRDDGTFTPSGIKKLQMRETAENNDQKNWMALYSVAQGRMLRGDFSLIPLRVEDNLNVLLTPLQVQDTLEAAFARNNAILFEAALMKTAVRAATTAEEVHAIGWPE